MDLEFNRQKLANKHGVTSYRSIFWVLWLVSWAPFLSAVSKNDVWIGKIQDLKTCKSDDHTILLSVALQEYISEGTFDDFDENKVVYIDKNKDFTEWTVYFDNVKAKDFQNYEKNYLKEEMLFWKSIRIASQPGGYANPNRTQTADGRPISTARMIVTGYVPIYIYLESVDKDNPSDVLLVFKITDQVPPQKIVAKSNGNMLEICVEEFDQDRPVGKFLSKVDAKRLTPKTREYLDRLQKMPGRTFVQLIYQSRYQDVNTLKRQLDGIKSELGEVLVLEPNAQILIRDRADYVLDMLHLLLAIDIPIPQVIIDVQIIERNMVEGMDLASSFEYLGGKSKKEVSAGHTSPGYDIEAPLKGEHISGIYRYLHSDFLEQFQFQMNAEIREGKSQLKASTRIICKNREAAKFNSGNRIPYYQSYDFTRTDKSDRYRTRERTESADEDPTEFPTRTRREYNYDEQETEDTRRWQLQFVDTGVNLWVQPYIKNSEWVDLALKPSYSEITGTTSYTNLPILSNRSLETSVTVKNGDTFLLAGLLYEKELKAVQGVPILMDIPLLKYLFSSEITQKQQTEVIFVLTVHIHYPGK